MAKDRFTKRELEIIHAVFASEAEATSIEMQRLCEETGTSTEELEVYIEELREIARKAGE